MYNKRIKYIDYFGVERTETFSFSLSEIELLEWETKREKTLSGMITEIAETNDKGVITDFLSSLILESYGQISDDGKRFVKTEEMKRDFKQSRAYESLFRELGANEKAAIAFLDKVIDGKIHRDT